MARIAVVLCVCGVTLGAAEGTPQEQKVADAKITTHDVAVDVSELVQNAETFLMRRLTGGGTGTTGGTTGTTGGTTGTTGGTTGGISATTGTALEPKGCPETASLREDQAHPSLSRLALRISSSRIAFYLDA